jgi:hypothetical protein
MNPYPPRRFVMRSSCQLTVPASPPRQLAISLDRPVLNGMTSADRTAAVRRLANLLMEAVGADPEEICDDNKR